MSEIELDAKNVVSLDPHVEKKHITLPATITINARGTRITIPKEIAIQSEVLQAFMERWNDENKEFGVNYRPEEVHKWLDALNPCSFMDYMRCWGIKTEKKRKMLRDVVKVDNNGMFTVYLEPSDVAVCTRGYWTMGMYLNVWGLINNKAYKIRVAYLNLKSGEIKTIHIDIGNVTGEDYSWRVDWEKITTKTDLWRLLAQNLPDLLATAHFVSVFFPE